MLPGITVHIALRAS